MTRVRFLSRTASLAIALAATGVAVPAFAQDAAVAPPPVVATQPSAPSIAPPPVVRTIADQPIASNRVAPEAKAQIDSERPAAPAKKAVAVAAKPAVRTAAAVSAPTAAAAATVSSDSVKTLPVVPDDQSIIPAAEADITSAAPVVDTEAQASAPANDFGASENDWLYWVGGLAGLLGLAGAGAALSSRRSRRHSNEHFAEEPHVIVESHEAPSFAARPAFAAAPSADAQFAPPASTGYASGYRSDAGQWTPGYFESMVEDGPSEVNPFLTRKNRLRRARFLDRQAANNETIYDWRGVREIQFASQANATPELVH